MKRQKCTGFIQYRFAKGGKPMSRVMKKATSVALAAVVALTVLAVMPAPALAADIEMESGLLATNLITVNTTVVGFAGREWYVIGDGSSGVCHTLRGA
jgi:hypothetical protein